MRPHPSITTPIARMPGPRLAALAAASAVVVAAGGCTGSSSGAGTTTVTAAARTGGDAVGPDAPAESASPTASALAPTASTQAPSPSALPTIATRRGSSIDAASVEVTLNSVVVDAAMMTVTWTARNAGQQPWIVGDYFFAGYYFDSAKGSTGASPNVGRALAQSDGQADGVYVLDRAHARRYLTGRDKDARCACSGGLAMASLEPGGEAVLQAQYQAPPADVTSVDVVIPNVGSFRDVAVTRS